MKSSTIKYHACAIYTACALYTLRIQSSHFLARLGLARRYDATHLDHKLAHVIGEASIGDSHREITVVYRFSVSSELSSESEITAATARLQSCSEPYHVLLAIES